MRAANENPYRAQRIEALAFRGPGFSWDGLLARLGELAYQGAVVGPHGGGKTTLLLELAARLETAGKSTAYIFMNEATPRDAWEGSLQAAVEERAFVIIDGAEQLKWWAWRRVLQQARACSGLVISCHRPGRLPTLWTVTPTPALLLELIEVLSGPPSPEVRATAEEAWRRHDGNIREVFATLYDRWADGVI